MPDIGNFAGVEVIEILVAAGDRVVRDVSLVSLESDKATMEIPSPYAGVVRRVLVSVGDRVSEGSVLLEMEVESASAAQTPALPSSAAGAAPLTATPQASARGVAAETSAAARTSREAASPRAAVPIHSSVSQQPAALQPAIAPPAGRGHASPAVRRFARELGVELARVVGSGRKGRVLKEDVQAFVKQALSGAIASIPSDVLRVTPLPVIDFAKFGPVEVEELTKIKRLSGANLWRAWVTIPHVTQFDEADITDLENHRKAQQAEAQARGTKLTMLAFLLKAVVQNLRDYPRFCASLDASGERLLLKRYCHIGVAVDTPQGLVVPVIRDVDQKDLFALAVELQEVSARARNRKLRTVDLEGACFTISSLGGFGGTFFSPVINAPEVAILGVSRHAWKPVFENGAFVPRLILPFALSYDHRVIDGVEGVKFTTALAAKLADLNTFRAGAGGAS